MTKFLPYIISGLFLLGCIVRFPVIADDVRISYRLVAEYAVIAGLSFVIMDKISLWLGVFVLLALMSHNFPMFNKFTFLANYAVIIGAVWMLIITLYGSETLITWLLNAMCVVMIIHMSMAFMQWLDIDPFFVQLDPDRKHIAGIMGNPNIGSALAALLLPAFMRKYWIWGMVVIIPGMLVFDCIGGIAAVACGGIFYLCVNRKLSLPVF